MKKIPLFFVIFFLNFFFSSNLYAITTLQPGDIVIISANSDGTYPGGGTNSNGFDFVSRVDLDAGTQIYFTDKGWDGSIVTPFWRSTTGEGAIRYTVPGGGISAGTIIHYDDTKIPSVPSSGTGTWDMYSISATGAMALSANATNSFDLATAGDNILVFQGSGANPQFLYGVGLALTNSWINTGSPSSNNSYIPSSLSLASKTIVSLGNLDNYQYNCSTLGIYSSSFLTAIANAANWNVDDITPYSVSTCAFSKEKAEILSLQRYSPLNSITNSGSLTFRATFSGAVSGVDTSDFTFGTGSLTGSISSIQTISSTIYNIIVNGFSGEGFVNLDVASLTGVTNTYGNPLLSTIPTTSDESYTIDITPPNININAPTKLLSGSITDTTFTITDAQGVDISSILLGTGGLVTSGVNCTPSSGTGLTVSCSVTIQNSGNFSVRSNDIAGNTYTKTETNYIVDTIAPQIPTVHVDTSGTGGINSPVVTFSSSDNIAIGHYSITYIPDNGLPGVGTETTLDSVVSPIILNFDPDETLHEITVTVYDTAGNSRTNTVRFPPIITFTAPTTLSNTGITDTTITITSPDDNDLDNIVITTDTGGVLTNSFTCEGEGSDTVAPYASPVTCTGGIIGQSGIIQVNAQDIVTLAVGQNTQSYVIDTLPPVISISGASTINHEVLTTYTDAGATCNDNYDGSCIITSTGSVNTGALGVNTITYSTQDAAGNISSLSRTVTVVDTTKPIITLIGSGSMTVVKGQTYSDSGATASDNFNGNLTSSIVASGSVDTNTIGVYTITYDVTDSSSNAATQVSRTINVVAGNTPIITLNGSGSITVVKGQTYTDSGATASDVEDGNLTSSIVSSGSVNTGILGIYTITYDVTDSSGNHATQASRTINVVSGNPPVISLIGSGSISLEIGSSYTDSGATASDVEDGNLTSSIVSSGSVNTGILGIYTITYDVTDSSGNHAIQASRTVTVADTTKPIITLIGSGSITVVKGQTYSDSGATASDNFNGNLTSSIVASGSVDTGTIGVYTITYDVSDSSSNAAIQVSRTINVVSGNPPVISLIGTGSISLEVGSSYTDSGATASDGEDGNLTSSIIASGSVDTHTLGIYTITYDVTDISGNSAIQASRTVTVVDTTKPIITLIGSGSITIVKGQTYSDSGATASDNFNGNLTSSIVSSGSVDTGTIGIYTITYDVSDSSSNAAIQASRTINVVAGNTPTITLNGSGSVTVVKGYNYTDSGATASDVEDGNLTSSIVASGSVNTGILGIYTITYDVTDSSGNHATQASRTINVVSGNPPVISLIGSGSISLEVGSSYTDSGATASDVEDGNLTSSIVSSGSVNTGILGTYTITYDVIDSSGNHATQASRTVTVADMIKPIITLSGSSSETLTVGDTYTELGATCSDNYDISCSVVSSGSVDTNTPGTYTIRYNVSDTSGNPATQIIRTVTVVQAPTSNTSGGSGPGTPAVNFAKDIDAKVSSFDGVVSEKAPQGEGNNTNNGSTTITDSTNTTGETNKTKEVNGKTVEYTLHDTFKSCGIIDNLNDDTFSFAGGSFPDTSSSEYKDIIDKFVSLKIIDGNINGLFEPKRKVTRAEFTKMILISHCYSYKDEDTTSLEFKDIAKDSWEAKVVSKAEKLGIISGDKDQKGNSVFRPNDIVTKAEATKILIKIAFIQVSNLESLNYNDVSIDWHKKYIQIGESLGIFQAHQDNFIFGPNQGVSREEIVSMIQKIVKLYR